MGYWIRCHTSYKEPPIFTSIGNRSLLSKTVETKIQDAIVQRRVSPGEKLPSELELCSQFGVSRTVVREALRGLHAKGMITIKKGSGIFVRQFSEENVTAPMQMYLSAHFDRESVLDIIRARQIIEPSMAALAARRHTREDLDLIRNDIENLRKSTGDFGALARLDMQFHLDIAKASKNALMPLLLEPIHRLVPDVKSSIYATVKEAKTSALVWHEKIFRAIAAGKAEDARRAMVQHLDLAEKHTEQMLRARSKSAARKKRA